jgi:hypothetical protein
VACRPKLNRLLATLLDVRDVLEARVEMAAIPAWCERRGWTRFLLGLDDGALQRAEAHGLAAELPSLRGAPSSLCALAREVEQQCRLPELAGAPRLPAPSLRNVKLRKQAQLASVLAGVAAMAERAERIVDVGAGSGHLTRLSAELFGRPTLGLERNVDRVAAAERHGHRRSGSVRFVAVDARQDLQLHERDLAIGLHACGELGDRLLQHAARAGCDVALVSCCLQKISGRLRPPLSKAGGGLELKREHLGLTNLTQQPRGVETSIEATIAARQARFALGCLLRTRGIELEPGAEMSGINRRRASLGLAALAERALALRDLTPASASELAHHETAAAREYALVRRLSLPRSMLARALEVAVSLDRASHLEEYDYQVRLIALFDRGVSPRNIGLFASRDAARLPAC